MSRVGVATQQQQDRHGRFVASLRIASPYALATRYSDGGAGWRRHRSRRIGGKGK